jgi:hypothetical protein
MLQRDVKKAQKERRNSAVGTNGTFKSKRRMGNAEGYQNRVAGAKRRKNGAKRHLAISEQYCKSPVCKCVT